MACRVRRKWKLILFVFIIIVLTCYFKSLEIHREERNYRVDYIKTQRVVIKSHLPRDFPVPEISVTHKAVAQHATTPVNDSRHVNTSDCQLVNFTTEGGLNVAGALKQPFVVEDKPYLNVAISAGKKTEASSKLDNKSLNKDEIAAVINSRHLVVRKMCLEKKTPTVKRRQRFPVSPLVLTSYKPKIFFCPVAKAGSTFFTRYLKTIHENKTRSPYTIKIEDARAFKNMSYDQFKEENKQNDFLNQSFKFVFSRSPFGRLFSAYVDKLFSPNPYYWKHWGQKFMWLKPWKCGSGASFSSFIKTVIQILQRNDLHVLPITTACRLCEIKWDFIGRLENAAQDIDALSIILNVTSAFQHDPGYKMAAAVDAIIDSTKDVFLTWRKSITKCITMYDVGRIIWRKLQIRGIILKTLRLPFSQTEMNSVSLEEFQQACVRATETSMSNQAGLAEQRMSAFTSAYLEISEKNIQVLQKIYTDDLELLGYPLWPLSEKQKNMYSSGDIFNWRKPWT